MTQVDQMDQKGSLLRLAFGFSDFTSFSNFSSFQFPFSFDLQLIPNYLLYGANDNNTNIWFNKNFSSSWFLPLILAGLLVVLLLLKSLYNYITGAHLKKRTPLFPFKFDKDSTRFEHQRRKAFPPPYPNGWWKICDLSDLADGKILSVTALGHDYVVFQNPITKEVGVLDAFCPHLGAHLGNGCVSSEGNIKCPFHEWEFDTQGKAKKIPYCTAETLPATAKTKSHITRIYLDMVFIWFHCDQLPPSYQLQVCDTFDLDNTDKWNNFGTLQSQFNMHVSEMADNSADYYHFSSLHGPFPIRWLSWLIRIRYELKLRMSEDPSLNHVCYFDNWGEMWLFNKFRLKFTRQFTAVTFEGPSLVHFHIDTPLGSLHLIKTLLPLKPFQIYSEDTWYASKGTPRWLVSIIIQITKGALEQDRIVWESKKYENRPVFVKGDGPFPVHRRWYQQFYSENSRRYAYENEHGSINW